MIHTTNMTIWGVPTRPLHLEHAEQVIEEARRQRSLLFEAVFAMQTATVAELSDATGLLPATIKVRLDELCGSRGHPSVLICLGHETWTPRTTRLPVGVQ